MPETRVPIHQEPYQASNGAFTGISLHYQSKHRIHIKSRKKICKSARLQIRKRVRGRKRHVEETSGRGTISNFEFRTRDV